MNLKELSSFSSLALHERIVSALDKAGYNTPTEIQRDAIPLVLEGCDLMASAQTGTGKTAAFTLPLLQNLYEAYEEEDDEEKKGKHRKRTIQALILSPTRELAQQIEESVKTYGQHLPFKTAVLVGGLPIKRQINALQKGVDIVIATPGRLLDLLERRVLNIRKVNYFVLDEADRMLDMGFVHDVKEIAKRLSKKRQTVLFSATMTNEVKHLAKSLLTDPKSVAVHAQHSVAEKIEQKVYLVDRENKLNLLFHLLDDSITRVLIFTSTKSSSNIVEKQLIKNGISAAAIHSDKNQRIRSKALKDFDTGNIRVLVATDVVARGIDVDDITHVINYELPTDPETYVHRIGRTARAGSSGIAYSLCDMHEVSMLQAIQQLVKEELTPIFDQPYHSPLVQTMSGHGSPGSSGKNRRRRLPRRR